MLGTHNEKISAVFAATPAAAAEALASLALVCERALVLPTAAAFGGMDEAIAQAHRALEAVASTISDAVIVNRREAEQGYEGPAPDLVYFTQGSGLHVQSVLRNSTFMASLRPHVVVAVGESAMVISDPMVDPRGGAPTIGFGFERRFALLHGDAARFRERTRALLDAELGLAVLGADGWLVVAGNHVQSKQCTWVGQSPGGLTLA